MKRGGAQKRQLLKFAQYHSRPQYGPGVQTLSMPCSRLLQLSSFGSRLRVFCLANISLQAIFYTFKFTTIPISLKESFSQVMLSTSFEQKHVKIKSTTWHGCSNKSMCYQLSTSFKCIMISPNSLTGGAGCPSPLKKFGIKQKKRCSVQIGWLEALSIYWERWSKDKQVGTDRHCQVVTEVGVCIGGGGGGIVMSTNSKADRL